MNKITSSILTVAPSSSYALLDSGEGMKLERFGDITLARPDPQSLWRKGLSDIEWKKADGTFGRQAGASRDKGEKGGDQAEERGNWTLKKDMPEKWSIDHAGLKFWIKPTPFKHVGIFPEQAENWKWVEKRIQEARSKIQGTGDIEVLNLFAYTGGATMACAQAGAKVVHVDGSKAAIAWARENADLSGLKDKPIRWILDDVREFVRREAKRGRTYHGIIMDPPAFGHGPDNELWKIEEDLLPLIELCTSILADDPLFFIINGYSAGYSSVAYRNNLLPLVERFGGDIEIGELTLEEERSGRLLPCGIFARWGK